jgi:hypothetical protein
MPSAERCIVLFASVHDVMAAEKALRRSGYWLDIVPTPRELTSDCGMALEVRGDDLAGVIALLHALALHPRAHYRRGPSGFEPI